MRTSRKITSGLWVRMRSTASMPFVPCARTVTSPAESRRYCSSWRARGSSSMIRAVRGVGTALCYSEASLAGTSGLLVAVDAEPGRGTVLRQIMTALDAVDVRNFDAAMAFTTNRGDLELALRAEV